MQNPSLTHACFLLRLSSYGILLFSAVWWTAALPSFDMPAKVMLDTLVWPIDGSHDVLSKDARWLSVIGSGLIAAFAGMLLWVVIPELQHGNYRVIKGAKYSIWAWYIVDSLGSVLVGVASNAVFNTVFLLMLLIPLWLAERAQH